MEKQIQPLQVVTACKRCGELGHDESKHDQPLVGADGKTQYANLVVMKKAHMKAPYWEPLKPEDVPEWVKDPGVMAHLVKGEVANNEARGKEWYCARPAAVVAGILAKQQAAQAKRDRKAQKRVDQLRGVKRKARHDATLAVKH